MPCAEALRLFLPDQRSQVTIALGDTGGKRESAACYMYMYMYMYMYIECRVRLRRFLAQRPRGPYKGNTGVWHFEYMYFTVY